MSVIELNASLMPSIYSIISVICQAFFVTFLGGGYIIFSFKNCFIGLDRYLKGLDKSCFEPGMSKFKVLALYGPLSIEPGRSSPWVPLGVALKFPKLLLQ